MFIESLPASFGMDVDRDPAGLLRVSSIFFLTAMYLGFSDVFLGGFDVFEVLALALAIPLSFACSSDCLAMSPSFSSLSRSLSSLHWRADKSDGFRVVECL